MKITISCFKYNVLWFYSSYFLSGKRAKLKERPIFRFNLLTFC